MDKPEAPPATPSPARPAKPAAPAEEIRVTDAAAARGVVPRRVRYADGHRVGSHWHSHGQFLFAVAGTMAVRTPRRAWIVPPSRALWLPARTVHAIEMHGLVDMRTLYFDAEAAAGLPTDCVVLEVTPLARELVVRVAALAGPVAADSDDALMLRLLQAEIRRLPPCALDLPLPESPELRRLCEQVLAELGATGASAQQAQTLAISARTLYRRFLAETGLTFTRWRQQARLMQAVQRLVQGEPVTTVALDLGYDSPSAFSAMFRRALGMAPREFLRGDAS